MSNRYRIRGVFAALSLALAATGAARLAAQTGAVSGVVTGANTGLPLAGAAVRLAGTEIRGLTDAGGRYRLVGVSPGSYTVSLAAAGYRALSRRVQIVPDTTREADFHLVPAAINPGGVVRGDVAGPAERRGIGVSLPVLEAGRIAEMVPVDGFSQLLEGRFPGVRSHGTNGGIGAGRELRIRGTDSFGFTSQRPVVYIDGIRVDTNKLEWGGLGGTTCCLFSGGAGEDRLSDLNPEEIDRVEILKGPAAAALYGAEGSGGVILVYTRRGEPDTKPSFTLNTGAGRHRLRANLPTTLRPNFEIPVGRSSYQPADPNQTLIETGPVAHIDLAVSGGGEDMAYFASFGLTNEEGSVQPNDRTRANFRVNFDWTVAEDLSVSVATGYVRNVIRSLQSGNNWLGVYTNAMLSPLRRSRSWLDGLDVSVRDARAIETLSDTDRWTERIRLDWDQTPNLTHRFTFGMDNVREEKSRLVPVCADSYWPRDCDHYTYLGRQGERNNGHRHSRKYTVRLQSTYDYDNAFGMGFLTGSLSVGGQFYRDEVYMDMRTRRGLDLDEVCRRCNSFWDWDTTERVGYATYAQSRLRLAEGLFLTTALRLDEGSEYKGVQSYPKADVAYTVPPEVLPGVVSNLKLRAALGWAGKSPTPLARFPAHDPTAILDEAPGVAMPESGNPDIQPENKREFETGLDLGLLEDRLGLELTYYDQRVVNALLVARRAPSVGGDALLENCCEIMNHGLEIAAAARPVDLPSLRWTTSATYEWNRNEIVDLGPHSTDDSIALYRESADGTWEHAGWRYAKGLHGLLVGQSLGDIVQFGIAGYDPDSNLHDWTRWQFRRGGVHPTHVGSVFNSFQIAGDFRLSFQLRGEMGAVMANSDRAYGARLGVYDEYLRHLGSGGESTPQSDSVRDYHRLAPVDKRDHIRLQEVALTYTLPKGIAGVLGLERTTITLSGYNVHWWDRCNCPDPSQKYNASDFNMQPFMAVPQPRRFLLSVRTRF